MSERIDDLQLNGLKIIQDTDYFCFGLDAVLLANFAKDAVADRILDFCSGNGIVPILLSAKTSARRIEGIEIQQRLVSLARRSAALNDLSNRLFFTCGDIKQAEQWYEKASFDTITCNPPYMKCNSGLKNSTDVKTVARHEIHITLEDIIAVAEQLLKTGGKFFMIHRPERLVDIFYLMRTYHIEPKRLRMVHPAPQKRANLVLVEGVRRGRPDLKMMPPLYVYDENGSYTNEINAWYGRRCEIDA